MTVTVYKSTDASAPVLTGQVGALITVLDAILVNGYGAKASQGWTKPLTGTNLASYLQPAGSNGFSLRIDDSNAQNAQLRGYESISNVTTPTGVNPFPTTAQVALGSGLYVFKSTTADATARAWIAIGNGKLLHFFVNPGSDTNNFSNAFTFGDIKTLKSGDAYHTICGASSTASNTGSPSVNGTWSTPGSGVLTTNLSGLYIARSYLQTGTALNPGGFLDVTCVPSNTNGPGNAANMPFPSGPDAAAYLSPRHLTEVSGPHYRGTVPGLWFPGHSKTAMGAATGDTIAGASGLASRTFEAILVGSSGVIFMETTNTWDT